MAANVVVSASGRCGVVIFDAKGLGGLGRSTDAKPGGPAGVVCRQEEPQYEAAVPPGTTSDRPRPSRVRHCAGWRLRDRSIIGALEPRMRRVPFRTQVPRETGAGTGGAWVAEGLSTPLAASAYDTITQDVYKAGKIVTLSKELLRVGNPDAERTVRETVMAGVAAYLDGQFLDPAVTFTAHLRPASITNGATAVTSTGATAAAVAAALGALVAAITVPGAGLSWIMRRRTMATIAGALGAASGLPASLYGLPVIVSDNSPASDARRRGVDPHRSRHDHAGRVGRGAAADGRRPGRSAGRGDGDDELVAAGSLGDQGAEVDRVSPRAPRQRELHGGHVLNGDD